MNRITLVAQTTLPNQAIDGDNILYIAKSLPKAEASIEMNPLTGKQEIFGFHNHLNSRFSLHGYQSDSNGTIQGRE